MATVKSVIETEEGKAQESSFFRQPQAQQSENSGRFFGRGNTITTDAYENIYSGRDSIRPTVEIETRKRRNRLTEEDLMPSIETMSYVSQKKKAETREFIEGKTKVLLAVYMLIVILLAAIVIGTGILINSMTASITRLSGEIEARKEVIASQNEDLAVLSDSYRISGVAQDQDGLNMGTINESEIEEIELIPFVEQEAYSSERDWFDVFSDLMQGLLGN